MASIKLQTVTGLTASDGSTILSGATVKFDTILHANGIVKIYPKIYRDDIAYASGYSAIYMRSEDFPDDLTIANLNPDAMYNLTTTQLYNASRNAINGWFNDATVVAVVTET